MQRLFACRECRFLGQAGEGCPPPALSLKGGGFFLFMQGGIRPLQPPIGDERGACRSPTVSGVRLTAQGKITKETHVPQNPNLVGAGR